LTLLTPSTGLLAGDRGEDVDLHLIWPAISAILELHSIIFHVTRQNDVTWKFMAGRFTNIVTASDVIEAVDRVSVSLEKDFRLSAHWLKYLGLVKPSAVQLNCDLKREQSAKLLDLT